MFNSHVIVQVKSNVVLLGRNKYLPSKDLVKPFMSNFAASDFSSIFTSAL